MEESTVGNERLCPSTRRHHHVVSFVVTTKRALLRGNTRIFHIRRAVRVVTHDFRLQRFRMCMLAGNVFTDTNATRVDRIHGIPAHAARLNQITTIGRLSHRVTRNDIAAVSRTRDHLIRTRDVPFPGNQIRLLTKLSNTFYFTLVFNNALRTTLITTITNYTTGTCLLFYKQRPVNNKFHAVSATSLVAVLYVLNYRLLRARTDRTVVNALVVLAPNVTFAVNVQSFIRNSCLSNAVQVVSTLLVTTDVTVNANLILKTCTT